MKEVLQNIKVIRRIRGLTQSQMAERLGIVVSGYGKIENGKIQLTIERLDKIARIFDVPVQALMKFHESGNLNFSHFEGEKPKGPNGDYSSKLDLEKASEQLKEKKSETTSVDENELLQHEGDITEFIKSFPPEKILLYAVENKNLKVERSKMLDIICESVFDRLLDKKKSGLAQRFNKKLKSHELIVKLLISEILSEGDVETMSNRFLKYKGIKL